MAREGQGPAHEDVPDAATKLSIEVKLAVDGLVAYYFRFLEDVGIVFWHVMFAWLSWMVQDDKKEDGTDNFAMDAVMQKDIEAQ